MKNKIKSMKKCVLTITAVVCGVFASNAISSGGLVETSYANNSVTIGEGTKIEVGEGKDGGLTLTGAGSASISDIVTKMIGVIRWITLVGTIVLLGIFVFNLIKMGAAGTNVANRTAAQQALVWSGVSAALLSIATSVFFFMSGMFK